MKFDQPAGPNPIDKLTIVGAPIDRIDGQLKTTGTAKYAYERQTAADKPAYGFVIGAAIFFLGSRYAPALHDDVQEVVAA